MSTKESHSILIDQTITLLRQKKRNKQKVECTIDEVIESLPIKVKNEHNLYAPPQQLNIMFQDHCKLYYNLEKRTLTFRHRFKSVHDLIQTLYTQRIGVRENDDLYDDIDRSELIRVFNYLRRIEIKEKKTKPADVIYFAKNHVNDPVDKMNLEENVPKKLREYWDNLDMNEIIREKNSKVKMNSYLDCYFLH